MINNVTLVGRLVRDPELRTATSGNSVCSFDLAVDGRLKAADGKYNTCFIGCVCFGKIAETTAKSVRKGSLVGVVGSLNQRKYQRKDGTPASIIEVICDSVRFLDSKEGKTHEEVPPFDDAPAPADTTDEESRNLEPIDLSDDDLPF